MATPFLAGGLAGRVAAFLAGHSPPEAVKLALGFRRALIVASVDGNQHLPEPCDRGILGPEVIRRLGTGHDPLRGSRSRMPHVAAS